MFLCSDQFLLSKTLRILCYTSYKHSHEIFNAICLGNLSLVAPLFSTHRVRWRRRRLTMIKNPFPTLYTSRPSCISKSWHVHLPHQPTSCIIHVRAKPVAFFFTLLSSPQHSALLTWTALFSNSYLSFPEKLCCISFDFISMLYVNTIPPTPIFLTDIMMIHGGAHKCFNNLCILLF